MTSSIVITGGAGFIGSHLAESLVEENRIIIVDDFSNGRMANLSSIRKHRHLRIVRADIRNAKKVNVLLKSVDVVFHEAARVSVPASVRDPVETNSVNVDGTLTLLNAAVRNGVGRFVFASSSSVYGDTGSMPKNERMFPKPISPYASSKLAGEYYCRAFYKSYGLETVSLRYFNVYGPRQRTGPYAGVITSFIGRLLAGLPPIIYGDGKQTRDFTFISDVVAANSAALTCKNGLGESFNVGRGKPITISKLAKALIAICNVKSTKPVHRRSRPGEVRHSCADTLTAKRTIGVSPKVGLTEGLEKTVQSLRGIQ